MLSRASISLLSSRQPRLRPGGWGSDPFAASSRSLYDESYYDVLKVPRDASPREIKEAYLRLSKELHPDRLPTNESVVSDHERFVNLNNAYNVLRKPAERRKYDLGLPRERPTMSSTYYEPMTFEERKTAYGFPKTNPNYYRDNPRDRYYTAAACVAFAIFGAIIHFSLSKMMFEKHRREMTEMTQQLNQSLEEARAEAKKFNSVEERWADLQKKVKRQL